MIALLYYGLSLLSRFIIQIMIIGVEFVDFTVPFFI